MAEPSLSTDRIHGGLWGALIGDALGVPVEFADRPTLQINPVTSMREYGTHHQPRGTWSDDGAMTLCTIDSLINYEFNLSDMGGRFARWMNYGLWTANGDVFDVGGTTATALNQIARGISPEQSGGKHEDQNGNGSLMRILPVALRFANEPTATFARHLEAASAITHAHPRSLMSCVFYGLTVRGLLVGQSPSIALAEARRSFTELYHSSPEFGRFKQIINDDFDKLSEGKILSTGYVLHTLHASLWCLLTTHSFKDCVLRAVNLGGDTDTTGCVAGGLAGIAYGFHSLPSEWMKQLARKDDLEKLFQSFSAICH